MKVGAMANALPTFSLHEGGPVTESARRLGVVDYAALAAYVQGLRYARPSDTIDPTAVLDEGCGTCSTKHQLLATVAHECGHQEVELIVGVYEMSERQHARRRAGA